MGSVTSARAPLGYCYSFIGLAPVVLNPVEVLAVIALLTPLTWMEVVGPRPKVFEERILWSGFLTESLGMAIVWAYLGFSFALGSVPSRKDFSSVPVLLLLFALTTFILSFFREASENTLLPNLAEMNSPPEQ